MDKIGADSQKADCKEENFRAFLVRLYECGDAWIKDNFVPQVIADKFNEYCQRIKNSRTNGKHTNNPYGVSEEYIASIARDLGGGL